MELVVVKGDPPCLFGRNWLRSLKVDWNSIFCVNINENQVKEKANEYPREFIELLKGHKELFSSENSG
ncbi:MAG: hypothetical protein AAFP76_17580, partial [Bacteroidota bacterium]